MFYSDACSEERAIVNSGTNAYGSTQAQFTILLRLTLRPFTLHPLTPHSLPSNLFRLPIPTLRRISVLACRFHAVDRCLLVVCAGLLPGFAAGYAADAFLVKHISGRREGMGRGKGKEGEGGDIYFCCSGDVVDMLHYQPGGGGLRGLA